MLIVLDHDHGFSMRSQKIVIAAKDRFTLYEEIYNLIHQELISMPNFSDFYVEFIMMIGFIFNIKYKTMGKLHRTQQIIGLIKNARQMHDKAQYRSLTYAPTQQ